MITDFNDLRQRILRNEPLSVEEYRTYLASRREGRIVSAANAAAKAKRTSKTLTEEQANKLLEDF